MSSEYKEKPVWKDAEGGRAAYCQHDVDCQVHCCFCHNGFLFEGMQHDPECPFYEMLYGRPTRNPIKWLINRFREWWTGKCPFCGSLNIKDVYQWDKQQCDDCGKTWNIPGF